jgi:hypothetical protein
MRKYCAIPFFLSISPELYNYAHHGTLRYFKDSILKRLIIFHVVFRKMVIVISAIMLYTRLLRNSTAVK